MVLPLIPLAVGAASLAAGALGLKKGFDAKKIMEQAREIGEEAQRNYEEKIKELDEKRELVNRELQSLGEYKKDVFQKTLGYIVFQVKNARSSIQGFDEHITSIDVREVEIFDRELTQISTFDISNGAVHGFAAGAAGAFGAYGTVGLLASASTGTAISTLSGAAATNATLAWLGGGSLAAGGLGIAGGTWVLGGLVAGPALAIAGYTLASKAEEALTKAEEYKAKVEEAIAELETPKLLLEAIKSNIDDTTYVLAELIKRFNKIRRDYDKHLLKDKGWRKLWGSIRGSAYRKHILQAREEKLENLVSFGKTIKSVISEPLLDATGAAAIGFNTRITGIAQASSIIENHKFCENCGKAIPILARNCPECKTPQVAKQQQIELKKTSKKSIFVFFSLFFLAGIIFASIRLLSETNLYNLRPTQTEAAPLHPISSTSITSTELTPVTQKIEMPLIDKITQRETIGMSIQYFEKIVGPAKIIGPQPLERTYEIDGCKIKTTLNNEEQKSILALNISITPQCNAKFGNFISETSKDTPLNTLTFGALEKLLDSPTEYYADCLIGCGNAYDPSVYLYWQGSHAQGFLKVMAAVTLTEDDALNAAGNWTKAMTKFEGGNWVVDAEFNCQPEKYSNIARNIFSDIKITSLTIGYSVNEFNCKNQTTHSQQ